MGRVYIFAAIEIIRELSRKELKSQFSRFSWGTWWIFLLPIFVVLGISWAGKVALRVNEADFSLFLALGFVFWFFFANSVQEGIYYVLSQRQLFLSLHAIDLTHLPAVKVVTNFVILLSEVAVLVFFFCMKHSIGLHMINIVYLSVVFFLFTLGFTYMAAAVVIFLRDVLYVLSYLFMFLFWLTPVFYTVSQVPSQYVLMYKINPLTYLFDALYRGVFLSEGLGSAYVFLPLLASISFVAGVGCFVINKNRLVKSLLS